MEKMILIEKENLELKKEAAEVYWEKHENSNQKHTLFQKLKDLEEKLQLCELTLKAENQKFNEL